MDRAELGALRDAIDTILTWPDSVRDQIAQWLQTDVSKPNRADPGRHWTRHLPIDRGVVWRQAGSSQPGRRCRRCAISFHAAGVCRCKLPSPIGICPRRRYIRIRSAPGPGTR